MKDSIHYGLWSFKVQIFSSKTSRIILLYWNISKHNFALKIALLSMHPFFYCKSVTDGNTVLVWPRRFCLAHFRCRKDFYHQATWERRTLLEGHFYCWTSKNSVPIFILLNWIPPLAFCGACSDLLSCRTIWNFHFILYCLKTMCRIWYCLLIFSLNQVCH